MDYWNDEEFNNNEYNSEQYDYSSPLSEIFWPIGNTKQFSKISVYRLSRNPAAIHLLEKKILLH